MARPRTPTWKLKASGNYRPSKHGSRAGELGLGGGGMPPPPDFLAANPTALAEWRRLVDDPVYSAVLSPIFMPLVVEYCMETSEMMTDPAMSTAARRHRLRLSAELLLTPASRANHPLPAPARETENAFDDCDV